MIVFDWMQRVWSLARGSSQANSRKTNVADELQSAARGLGFLPQRVRGVDLDPALAEQARAGHMTETAFARQCGLNAVFSWYVWFLEAGGEDDDGQVGEEELDHVRRSDTDLAQTRRRRIPGFPQASYQRVENQENGLRVAFYDEHGRRLGALSLTPHGDSCTIDTGHGESYLVREVSKAEDLWAEARQH
jgi:hypothetical protein